LKEVARIPVGFDFVLVYSTSPSPVRLPSQSIVEQGTHDALLRQNGHYAALWRRQSGGFLDAAEMQAAE
jgi:hypothetical protein